MVVEKDEGLRVFSCMMLACSSLVAGPFLFWLLFISNHENKRSKVEIIYFLPERVVWFHSRAVTDFDWLLHSDWCSTWGNSLYIHRKYLCKGHFNYAFRYTRIVSALQKNMLLFLSLSCKLDVSLPFKFPLIKSGNVLTNVRARLLVALINLAFTVMTSQCEARFIKVHCIVLTSNAVIQFQRLGISLNCKPYFHEWSKKELERQKNKISYAHSKKQVFGRMWAFLRTGRPCAQ